MLEIVDRGDILFWAPTIAQAIYYNAPSGLFYT